LNHFWIQVAVSEAKRYVTVSEVKRLRLKIYNGHYQGGNFDRFHPQVSCEI
jgi:hypothetical protein